MVKHYTLGMPFADYKAYPAINASYIKDLVGHGAEYARYKRDHGSEKTTPALTLGRAVHSLILENETTIVAPPDGLSLTTKAGREWKAEQSLEVVSRDLWERFCGAVDAVRANELAVALLDDCSYREVTVRGALNNVPCKARFDACDGINSDIEVIIDLKTCQNIESFDRDFYTYGYDIQADFYRLLSGNYEASFFFIVVETTAPYRVRVFNYNEPFNGWWENLLHVLPYFESRELKPDCETYNLPSRPAWIDDRRDGALQAVYDLCGI